MRLTNHCFAVTGLGYLAPWCVNAGFIAGDAATLVIDTGGNTLAAQTIHGYACAARPENCLQVINTERHFDHIGGNGYFRAQGIDIWGHAKAVRTPEEFQAEIAEFNNSIADPVRRAHHESRAFFHDTNLVNPNRLIQAETEFELGCMKARILFTPGHTPTNLSVWLPQDGVLYTGDLVVREYLPNLDAGSPADWRIWLDSLDRIEALKPAFIVGGHGPISSGTEIPAVIDSVRKVLRESIARGGSPTANNDV